MIELTFASKRVVAPPPPVLEMNKLPWYPSTPANIQQLADAKNISIHEYMRRDKIVQELYATVKLKAGDTDRKSTRLNSSHITRSRMPSSA